jgi:elongation factor Ts
MNDEANAKKPENIIEKMLEGRLNKELKEFCLVDQIYVKDGDMSVGQYLASVAKQVGAPVAVKRFVRFETGEGLEKKSENFAEEVAKQMGN